MAEIGFYHLTRTTAEQALPHLLGKTLEAGERAVIRCATEARLAALDAALWLAAEPEWLPHGTTEADLQPIFLTLADENPNGARFLFLLDNTDSARLDAYARVFDLFDGSNEEAVAAARARYAGRRALGHSLTYWRQEGRRWVKGEKG